MPSKDLKLRAMSPAVYMPDGTLDPHTFKANLTITMGALKRGMFSDAAKEMVGEIIVADLGIHHIHYETPSCMASARSQLIYVFLIRTATTAHKGTYGHLAVVCGEKIGASVIAGSAAFAFWSRLGESYQQ